MSHSARLARCALILIVAIYVVLGVQYARLTPPWQAPDEPAHFNYVRTVAEQGRLPILQPGDYPFTYLEQIKAQRFPPEMSIDPIRYEAWQPPLYYLAAAVPYRLGMALGWSQGQLLLALRLLSVVLGAALLVVAYRVIRILAPAQIGLALGTTALAAAVPMHIAMTAAVNNDTLAELLGAIVLWLLLVRLQWPQAPAAQWAWLGIVLGLAGLAKLSTGALVPLVLAALIYLAWQQPTGKRARYLATRLAAVALPAALLLAPWVAHNIAVYGLGDPLVMRRHDAVVVGQVRTADWLAKVGPLHGALEFATTTFHSFWGQFGWMGVPIDDRIYRFLLILTGLALLGLALRLRDGPRIWGRLSSVQRVGLVLLAGSVLMTATVYIAYNVTFEQHQGRYLFPALIACSFFLTLGWREITRRAWRLIIAGLLIVCAVLLAARRLVTPEPLDKYTLAAVTALAGAFGLGALVPESWAELLYILPYPMLLVLDVACLYLFILPALR